MKKFLLLLKKELRELLTPQMIVPFVLIMVVFVVIGKTAGKQVASQASAQDEVLVLDHDTGQLSKIALGSAGQIAKITMAKTTNDAQFVSEMNKRQIALGVIIPADFSMSALNKSNATVKTYSTFKDFSLSASKKSSTLSSVVMMINDAVSNGLIQLNSPETNPIKLKNPVLAANFVSANGKTVEGSSAAVLGYISQQTNFVPVILFIVIVFAAQMIATAVATEKENKTLETLLSLPVSRKTIVSAKMIAAGLVSLLMAGIYMHGMKNFIGGIGSAATGSTTTGGNVSGIVHSLGLSLSATGYLELGVILFLGILLALAMAMILGAFSEDAKSAQSVITPLMVMVMIPYFATLLLDINQLSPLLRGILYAIPFSHIFLAAPNIIPGNTTFVLWGMLYLFVMFLIFVYVAAKIFSSDLILTMKLNFSKKKS